MTITARLFGGMYDGDVILCDEFMQEIPKPLDPKGGPGPVLVYRFVGQHPQDGTLMYLWREKNGAVRS